MVPVDIQGKRFGGLVARERVENDAQGKAQWLLDCDCGGTHTARYTNLTANRVRYCGACRSKNRRYARKQYTVESYFHVALGAECPDMQGFTQAAAGFCVIRDAQGTLIAPVEWLVKGHNPRHTPPAVMRAVRAMVDSGHIGIAKTHLAIRNWLKKATVDYRRHHVNDITEARPMADEYFRLRGYWKGPGKPTAGLRNANLYIDERGHECLDDGAQAAPTDTTPALAPRRVIAPTPPLDRAAERARILAELDALELA